jgi:hypothetical protein
MGQRRAVRPALRLVDFRETLPGRTFAAARVEDAPAQVAQKLLGRLRVAGRGRAPAAPALLVDEAQTLGVSQILPRLIARDAQPLLDGRARRAREARDLGGVVAVHEAQDEDAARLGRVLAHAGVVADLAQVVLHADEVARVGRAQHELGRVVLEDGGLVAPPPPGPPHLRYVEVAQHLVEIAVKVLDAREVRAGEGELDEGVVDEVFGARGVPARQPQRPRAQRPVAREEHLLVRHLFRLPGAWNFRRLQHHSQPLRRAARARTHVPQKKNFNSFPPAPRMTTGTRGMY